MNTGKLYLFCSFDLSNSTKHKYYSKNWVKSNIDFFKIISENIPFYAWRFLGDEIVMYKNVGKVDEVIQNVELIRKKLKTIVKELNNLNIKSNLFFKISVKTTIWCSFFHDVEEYNKNETLIIQNGKDNGINNTNEIDPFDQNIIISERFNIKNDFIGTEMDIGFRISKYSFSGGIIVSALLAFLLVHLSKRENSYLNLYNLGYESLKGVWDGRKYPIITYGLGKRAVKRLLPYDNYTNYKFIQNITAEKIQNVNSNFFKNISNSIPAFKCTTDKIKDIVDNNKLEITRPNHIVYVDLAMVCFTSDLKKVFIIKKVIKQKKRKEFWMFGSAIVKYYESLQKTLLSEYKRDFGFNVSILDNKPINKRPRIINTFDLELEIKYSSLNDKNGQPITHGLIYTGKIQDPIDYKKLETNSAKMDYMSDYRFIDVDELGEIKVKLDNCVPDFHNSIKLAYLAWKNN